MAVAPAIGAGLAFLLEARDGRDWWRDFDIAGPSTMWVTAYVAGVVAGLPDAQARSAAGAAWKRLERTRWWARGWGYGPWVPADADSTTWALRLGECLGIRRSLRMRRGYAFLARHLRAGGGLATYAAGGPIQRFTRLSSGFGGWCAPHTCVTAAAARLHGFSARERLLDHLRRRQRTDGGWDGYWWCDPEYTSALAAEALAADPRPGHRDAVRGAVRWAMKRVGPGGGISSPTDPSGSAFATACGVRILVLDPDVAGAREVLRRAVAWLVDAQHLDGSWSRSARLRVPPPEVADPETLDTWGRDGQGAGSIGTIVVDRRALYTTATVLGALHRVLARGGVERDAAR